MELRRKKVKENVSEGRREGKAWECFRERVLWSFILRAFIWRSRGKISIENSSAFQVCIRVVVFIDWSAPGQRIISHCSWSWCWPWHHLAWTCCFSGPGAETQLRPRCYHWAYCIRKWSCKGLCGSHMRLFSRPLIPPLGGYLMTSDMPGEERSGEGPSHMTSDMKSQGSKPHDQW